MVQQKKTTKKRYLFLFLVIALAIIVLLVFGYRIKNDKKLRKLGLENQLNSGIIPSDFKLIEEKYIEGDPYDEGSYSLVEIIRHYKVSGTRKEVMRDLLPGLQKAHYLLYKNGEDYEPGFCGYNFHTPEGGRLYLSVRLYPKYGEEQDDLDCHIRIPEAQHPETQVNEVVIDSKSI
jgi:hypothetical protein